MSFEVALGAETLKSNENYTIRVSWKCSQLQFKGGKNSKNELKVEN
jgi:hypothetical protein